MLLVVPSQAVSEKLAGVASSTTKSPLMVSVVAYPPSSGCGKVAVNTYQQHGQDWNKVKSRIVLRNQVSSLFHLVVAMFCSSRAEATVMFSLPLKAAPKAGREFVSCEITPEYSQPVARV